ncbi:MAG: radical SAM protein [Bdellovibrionales bacterium]|nr:radical SAM protein [Bdellovibrionales bacterium]
MQEMTTGDFLTIEHTSPSVVYTSEYSPYQVSIELTTACNYSCAHCATTTNGYVGRTMKKENAWKIIDQVRLFKKPPRNIRLFGQGEVSILPWLPEYISYIKKNLPKAQILISTNGSKLDVLAKNFVQNSVRRLFLSVEGGTQSIHERIRGKGSFYQLVLGLRALKREKKLAGSETPFMDFTTVLTRESVFDLTNLVRLAIRYGADSVKTQALVPHMELDLLPLRLSTLTPEEKIRAIASIEEAKALAKANNIEFRHLNAGDPFNEPDPAWNSIQKVKFEKKPLKQEPKALSDEVETRAADIFTAAEASESADPEVELTAPDHPEEVPAPVVPLVVAGALNVTAESGAAKTSEEGAPKSEGAPQAPVETAALMDQVIALESAPPLKFKNCIEPWTEAWINVSLGMNTCERRRFDVTETVDKVPLNELWLKSPGLNQVRSNLLSGNLDPVCAGCILRPASSIGPVPPPPTLVPKVSPDSQK